ncbi:hypothetical protein V6N13_037023 [Hibiscus sabdariffa]
MVEDQKLWDVRKVVQIFTAADATEILQCPISECREDIVRWSHHHSGIYSTKTAHHWLEKQEQGVPDNRSIWKAIAQVKTLPKIRIFGWRVGQGALRLVRNYKRPA